MSVATQRGFIEDIVADPDDDTPRLIFADWLDEHGEEERAEFIRLQCEYAGLEPCPMSGRCRFGTDPSRGGFGVGEGSWFCGRASCVRGFDITQRLCGLFSSLPSSMFAGLPGNFVPGIYGHGMSRPADPHAWLRRGFVESLTLPAEIWLAHAAALLARHPVREVRLTTWPALDWTLARWRTHLDAGGPAGSLAAGYMAVVVLHREWPRITFTPPAD
jgi:uncharacterized protein (TIGR02996 family)